MYDCCKLLHCTTVGCAAAGIVMAGLNTGGGGLDCGGLAALWTVTLLVLPTGGCCFFLNESCKQTVSHQKAVLIYNQICYIIIITKESIINKL